MRLSSSCLMVLAFAVVAFLSGCSSLRNGGAPDPAFTVQGDLAAMKQALSSTASVTAYYVGEPSEAKRNAFADSRIAMANLVYIQFISDLTADKQHLDAASDMLVLGLNLLGTAASGVRAQANLAATAAGVGGSKAIVDKNYYFEKTVSALVATMNASRKEVLLRILEGVRKPLADYTFSQAVADTHDYYAAGTLNSAIASAQASAAVRETKADQALNLLGEAKVLTDNQIDDRTVVVNAILAAVNQGDLAKMQNLLKLLGLEGAPQATVDEAKASLRSDFRRVLRDKPDLAKDIRAKLSK
jgi:hypothetical protein